MAPVCALRSVWDTARGQTAIQYKPDAALRRVVCAFLLIHFFFLEEILLGAGGMLVYTDRLA